MPHLLGDGELQADAALVPEVEGSKARAGLKSRDAGRCAPGALEADVPLLFCRQLEAVSCAG